MQRLKIFIVSIFSILSFYGSGLAVIDDSEFFNSLNLDYPGLESVKNALAVHDTSLAKQKLLEYYQDRTTIQYFPLIGSGSTTEANDNLNHYFTVVNIRKYAGEADRTVDWTTYDPGYTEWHYQFHRMYWITNLGKVFGNTKDEKYAKEWVAELIDWMDDNRPGYPRTLDTGIRLRNIVESYQYFIHKYKSSSVTSEDHLMILKSIMEQSRFLRDNWRSNSNWGAEETRGLGGAVVMFPEFKFTLDGNWEWWMDLVISRLDYHLSYDFYPDGVQFETSPAYHSLEYRNLFLAYQLIDMNQIEISESLKNKFIKPLEFMMHVHKPNKYLPQLSDTDQKSYLDRLKEGAILFNRQDMIYAATRGSEGTPPLETFAPFPDGGYFIMRSDWGENEANYNDTRYLVFDTGSNDPWHAHYDILNFEAYAFGKTIIKDPGKYAYTDRRLEYYKKTVAHNTIVIDDKNQAENTQGTPVCWESLPGFDYVDAYHDAYNSVRHQRKILFAKPDYWVISDLVTGDGSHSYDLYFHLEAAYLNHHTLNPEDNSVSTPNFAIIPGDQEADAEIVPGWVSYSVGSEQEAPTIKYSKQGNLPVVFETVIYPFGSGSGDISVEKLTVYNRYDWDLLDDEAVAMKIEFPDRSDFVCFNHVGEDSLVFTDFGFAGEVVYISNGNSEIFRNFSLVKGSSLSKNDTLLIDTNGSIANISWFRRALYIDSDDIRSAKIRAPEADSVLVNGCNISFTQNGDYVEFTVTALIDENISGKIIANSIQLDQNYPNPFNSSTEIRFVLYRQDHATLKIYNLTGQLVLTLLDQQMELGVHSIVWNGKDEAKRSLPSGIYFYRLQVGSSVETRSMLLLK